MLYHYIDNEVPDLAEWDSTVVNGDSALEQLRAAAWLERGNLGLRATIVGSSAAYAAKGAGVTIAPGGSIYIGFWFRPQVFGGSSSTAIASVYVGSNACFHLLYRPTTLALVRMVTDAGGPADGSAGDTHIANGRWAWVVAQLQRAATNVSADGLGRIWVNGVLRATRTGVDNYDRLGAGEAAARIGVTAYAQNGFIADFDEVKLADACPHPFCPDPPASAGDYVCPERLCVLYRDASADSAAFAYHAAAHLGLPLANLIPLPAAGNEGLVDYAAYQTQVESGIDAYFALNPSVAANCRAFLSGFGVPGCFQASGKVHSGASRLMRYGSAFSSGSVNPFYGTSARPTAAALAASGVFLAARIGGDTLAHAQAILDAGIAVSALAKVGDCDMLCTDDAALAASIEAQRTRLYQSFGQVAEDVALVVCDSLAGIYPGSLAAGGSRAAAVGVQDTIDTLREASNPIAAALITDGYAAGLGFTDAASDGLDKIGFVEKLRQGWTFAEAALAAVEHLDYLALPAGNPLMTVAFELGGYNLYRGDTPETIDWDSPVACVRPGENQAAVVLPVVPGRQEVLAVRAVSAAGVEEHSQDVLARVEVDGDGRLLPAPLAVPAEVTAQRIDDRGVLVGFRCSAQPGEQAPASFEVLTDRGTWQLDLQNPAGTITVRDPNQADFQELISLESFPAMIAVRSRREGRLGRPSSAAIVHAASPPSLPAVL